MSIIKIASRESKLAMAQSEIVASYINKDTVIISYKTTGDKILDRTLDSIGGKGLFIKEVSAAVIDGRADIAVHSLKDMPTEPYDGLDIIAYSKRENPLDVLILPEDCNSIDKSKPIGCAGSRRRVQLKSIFPDIEVAPIRGNVLTRLKKLDNGEYSALVLAAAGIIRLGLSHRINRYFSTDEIIPAAGQGIIAVQGRKKENYLNDFDCRESMLCAKAERAFIKCFDGGCSKPSAAYAEICNGKMTLKGLYVSQDESIILKESITGDAEKAEQLGIKLANILKGE